MSRLRSPLALLALLGAFALVLLTGCGSSDKGGSTQAQTSTDASSGLCQRVAEPAPKPEQHLRKPTLRLDPSKRWDVQMTTNCGSFTIRLDVAHAPRTAASFAYLVKRGFYDNLVFHRVATGFVVQAGDPYGSDPARAGSGGPGYTVVEPPPANLRYWHGVVAMAKSGTEPDGASGSQFFIVTAQDAQLPPQYALVGRVVKGLEAVDTIGVEPLQDPSSRDGPPAEPIVIASARLSSH
ncbi:MAG: peptidylprolyl isomerase [Actinobacteria bacterium]|nr:peptidylprolyl isomerase [Actinomycetota bacterium]